MKNLRVLHLSTEKSWRGGEQQIAYLIDELNKTDITNLLAVQKDSLFDHFCDQKGWVTHRLDFSNAFNIKTALKIKAICIREHVDLVHLHTAQAHGLGVLSVFLGSKTPLILSRRVAFVPKNSFFTKWKYNHPAIKKVICVSHRIETIMRSYLRHPEKSVTIHDGIDTQKFLTNLPENKLRQEFSISPGIFIIGNTSALAEHKDYYSFIDTINLLVAKKRPVIAFIIGHGPLEMNLKMYVHKLKLSDRIFFTGFRNDIAEILPCLNLFLMTSLEEGLGTSVLDAFAASVPVVSTNAGGLPEIVKHQTTGMLASIKDTASLAQGVEELMDNAALRSSIVQNAKEMVASFSKEIMAQKTATLYRQLAG